MLECDLFCFCPFACEDFEGRGSAERRVWNDVVVFMHELIGRLLDAFDIWQRSKIKPSVFDGAKEAFNH